MGVGFKGVYTVDLEVDQALRSEVDLAAVSELHQVVVSGVIPEVGSVIKEVS